MDEVFLLINGVKYSNWIRASITRDMKTADDTFALEIIIKTIDKASVFVPFGYQECQILINQDVIITGIIDIIEKELNGNSLIIRLFGRSKAGQLVDCSITERPFEFNNLTLQEIANKLIAPFGINAEFPDGAGNPFTKIQAKHGETVYSFLNKLALQRGFFLSSTNLGNIIFWRASSAIIPTDFLKEGQLPLTGIKAAFNGQIRYSEIMVESQQREGKESLQGKAIDSIVQESGILRPLLLTPTEIPEGLDLDGVAKWERGKRASESMPMTVSVLGWRKKNKTIWKENEYVSVCAPSVDFKIETIMLIESLTFNIDSAGKFTTLNLVMPNANTLNDEVLRPWIT